MNRLFGTTFGVAALVLALAITSTANATPSPPSTGEEAAAVFYDAVAEVLAENPWFEGTRVDSAFCLPSMVVLGAWHCVATVTDR